MQTIELNQDNLKTLSYYTLVELSKVTGYSNPIVANVKGKLTLDDRGNFIKYEQ
jgi:hypothetical protein